MWLNLLFALIGLLTGYVINNLADYLPAARFRQEGEPLRFQWRLPAFWIALHGQSAGRRYLLVELGTALLFAGLPSLIAPLQNLAINSFYIATLILIIVIDLEHRLIFDMVTYPATLLALLGSLVVTNDQNTIGLSIVGALAGFLIFFLLYGLAQLVYGPGSAALGAGDVKLALVLGAMLGFHRILFALVLGILLGGIFSLLLLLSRRVGRGAHLPYGQYLAAAGIIMLIWGAQVVEWYLN